MRRQAGRVLHEERWVTDKELRRLRDELEERRYHRGDMEARERYQRALVRKGHMKVGDICLARLLSPSWVRVPGSSLATRSGTFRIRLCGLSHSRARGTQGHSGLAISEGSLSITIGCVYGMRNLFDPHPEGYQLHGRVSIGGRKHKAVTGGQLLQRQDGSLVSVDVPRLHHGKRRSLFDYG